LTTISREALYDLVWNEPVSIVAQRLGVSDVWLKKCCARANIPVPERGYWAKLRAGKSVVRRDLSPRLPGASINVVVGSEPSRIQWPPNPEAELAAPPPTEPTFAESIEAVAERIERSLGKIRLVRDFESAHRLIRQVLDEDALRRLKPNDAPYRLRYSEPLFEPPFERRRLRILNSLFLALSQAGHQPWLGEPQARNIGVMIGSQRISFMLDHFETEAEANRRVRAPREAYEIMCLEIPATGDSWADDDKSRIEDRLGEIVRKLIVAGEIQYRASAQLAYRSMNDRRAAMARRLAEQRTETVKIAREEAVKVETERRKLLIQMAADHRIAEDIRAFVGAALQLLDTSAIHAGPAASWAAWAYETADEIDPVGKLQIAGDGTAATRSAASCSGKEYDDG